MWKLNENIVVDATMAPLISGNHQEALRVIRDVSDLMHFLLHVIISCLAFFPLSFSLFINTVGLLHPVELTVTLLAGCLLISISQ